MVGKSTDLVFAPFGEIQMTPSVWSMHFDGSGKSAIFLISPHWNDGRMTANRHRAKYFSHAEDGMRDTSVTGVQTCALPIWVGSGSTLGLRTTLHVPFFAPVNTPSAVFPRCGLDFIIFSCGGAKAVQFVIVTTGFRVSPATLPRRSA